MSLKFIDPIEQIISSSQINESHESFNPIQTPESFINALQEKLTKNPELIQEIVHIFPFIFSKPETSSSHPTLETLIENLDNAISNKNLFDPEQRKISEFKNKQAAGFLLIAFGLFKDLPELAVFIAKEFEEIWGNFLENKANFTLFEKNKIIYQGLFEYYKQFEEDVFLKIFKFLQANPNLVFFRNFFLKNVPFRKKATFDMLDALLEDYDDFNKFLCTNGRRILNEEEVFEKLLEQVLKENQAKTRKVNEDKILLRFSIKCLENKWESIFKLILKTKPILSDSMRLFRTALRQKNMFYLKKFLKINENAKETLLEEENFTYVLSFFENEDHFLDGVFLLNQIKDKDLNIFYQRIIIEKFSCFLSSTCSSQISLFRVMTSYLNPFALSIICSEIFYQISLRSQELQLKFNFLAVHFRDLAIDILEKLQKCIRIKPLLNKIFYPSDISVLDILLKSQEFFEIILTNANIQSIINEMWDSPYDKTNNIMNLSTNFCFLIGKLSILNDGDLNSSSFLNSSTNQSFSMTPSMSPVKSSPTKNKRKMKSFLSSFTSENFGENNNNLFQFFKTADILQKKTNFIFQLKVFCRCIGIRYLLEFLFFFIAFCIILTILMDHLALLFAISDIPNSIMFAIFSFIEFTTENSKDPVNMMNKMLAYFSANEQQAFLSFFMSGDFSNSSFVCQIVVYMDQKTMNLPSDSNDINFCLSVYEKLIEFDVSKVSSIAKEFIMIITTFSSILQLAFYFSRNKKMKISFYHFVDICILGFTIGLIYLNSIDDPNYMKENLGTLLQNMKIVLITLILLIFVKIVLFLRMSESIGIPLRIIFKMMSSLFIILVMFIIIFLSLSVFMYFLFTAKDTRFKSFFSTVKSMFKFMFGEYLNYYGESEIVDYSYFSIMTLSLIFIRIIFLNILIAILSNVYEKIQKKSGLEISLMTHELNGFQDPKDKNITSLVLIPAPFSFLSLVLSPLILIKRNKKLNENILKIGYFCHLCVIALIFSIINLVIVPLTWLKITWSLLTNNYGEYEISSFGIKTRIIHLAQWIILGPFFQIYILFRYDLPYFFKKAFQPVYIPSKLDEFSVQEYQILKKMIRIYREVLCEENVTIENFRKKFSKMFEMFSGYSEIKANYSSDYKKKNQELLRLMKNNFQNLLIGKEIRIEVIYKLVSSIRLMKKKKNDNCVIKYSYLLDLVNIQKIGDTIKLYQYKNHLLK